MVTPRNKEEPTATAIAALYDPVLVRHARSPYGRGPLAPTSAPTTSASGVNRPCGDRVFFHTQAQDGRLTVRFEGEGCALSIGSASALCEAVDGQPTEIVRAIAERYKAHLDGAPPTEAGETSDGGPALPTALAHFLAVLGFPARKGCVRLAPGVLLDALAAAPQAPQGDSR